MQRRNLLRSLASAAFSARAPAAKSQSIPFIQARDGTNLFYQDWGSGPPLVFIPPWSLNSAWWEYQIAYLADQGLRCVSFDRRGHGRSGWPGHGYDFDTLADDLAAVIQQLDLHGITLVGHSMG